MQNSTIMIANNVQKSIELESIITTNPATSGLNKKSLN